MGPGAAEGGHPDHRRGRGVRHGDVPRWTWRYDLAEVDGQTDVTLTYDWSNATPEARERFQFPPFPVEKLTESLDNLAKLASDH